MNINSTTFKVRLGLFITVGIALFILAIFVIGKQKNLFNPVFTVSTQFQNVSGLQVGNSVRFSGINIGTVDNIRIINDSTVRVDMQIKKDVHKFIKTDARAIIGSEGIIGDKLVIISNGGVSNKLIADRQLIPSDEPVETDAIIASLQITADNAAMASDELNEILFKINNGDGTLGRLLNDESIANNIDQTISNLKSSTKGLDENMEAAKSNFLLRGYFKKKERAEAKKKKEAEKKLKALEEEKRKQEAEK
ncbi:MAG: MCE family protein [Flavobacterium sp.]|nr:MCE family protein [Flavobacterium sp.]